MLPEKKKRRTIWRWILWVAVVQLVLVNVSAALYAYKFTHFNDPRPAHFAAQNIFEKTWKLFTGPTYYKMAQEKTPPFPMETITLKTDEGIPIDCWYSTVDSAAACVIFFHGITVNKTFVMNEAAMFRHWGYNVLLIDFRAHGKSGGHTSTFGMRETDEATKAFDWAKGRGNKKIILYGVSLGAGVCIKAVSENKIHPDAIIADMPFGSLHEHLCARTKVEGGFPPEPFGSLLTFWMGVEQGYNGFHHRASDYAKKITCPVLVQWGELDRYVSKGEAELVFSGLASANKRFVSYANADHESFLQKDPVKWEREVRAFLRSL